MSEITDINIEDCWNKKGTFAHSVDRCERLAEFAHCRNCPVYSESGRKLLAQPLTDEYQQEFSSAYEKPIITEKKKSYRIFVFRTGSEWLALNSRLINEVVDMGPIHSIPHKSSRIFRGLVNVRGRLELCVSIGGVLRLNPCSKAEIIIPQERLIVATKAGRSVVFPVSEVMGHLQYNRNEIKPLPITVSGSKAVYTKGIINSHGRDIGLLDDKLLFRILSRNL